MGAIKSIKKLFIKKEKVETFVKCDHDWEIVETCNCWRVYRILYSDFPVMLFDTKEKAIEERNKFRDGKISRGNKIVCLKCGECIDYEIIWKEELVKTETEIAARKKLAKRMWADGCSDRTANVN